MTDLRAEYERLRDELRQAAFYQGTATTDEDASQWQLDRLAIRKREAEAALDRFFEGLLDWPFTQEDVDYVRKAVVMERWEAVVDREATERLHAIADKIAARLAPQPDPDTP